MSDENQHDNRDATAEGSERPARRQPPQAATPAPKPRDADAARAAAAERVKTAELIATAVGDYHTASDRIEAANVELASASEARLGAINSMRTGGLTFTEIHELTGLSTSRVQALVRSDKEDAAEG